MSRKRIYPPNSRVSTTIKLPRDLLEQIEAIADERVVGRGWLIERLIRRGLQHLPSVEPEPVPLEAQITEKLQRVARRGA